MDHRAGQRRTVRLDVTLANRHSSEFQGEILDISAGGAFIRLQNHSDSSALRNIVRLRFRTRATDHEYHDCWAMIVRTEASGIGVMFDRRQEQAFEQLKSPTNAHPRERVQSSKPRPSVVRSPAKVAEVPDTREVIVHH